MSSGMFMCKKCGHVNKFEDKLSIGLFSLFLGVFTMGISLMIQIVNAALDSGVSAGSGSTIPRTCEKCGTNNNQ